MNALETLDDVKRAMVELDALSAEFEACRRQTAYLELRYGEAVRRCVEAYQLLGEVQKRLMEGPKLAGMVSW